MTTGLPQFGSNLNYKQLVLNVLSNAVHMYYKALLTGFKSFEKCVLNFFSNKLCHLQTGMKIVQNHVL